MRILLDENIHDNLVRVLTGLRHEVIHAGQTEYKGKGDERLVELAQNFDCLITCDLYRQEAEWLAVHHALVEGRIRVVWIRLSKKDRDPVLGVARALINRMEEWIQELNSGKCLVILSKQGAQIRAKGREEVLELLDERVSRGREFVESEV